MTTDGETMSDPNELGRLLARFARTGSLPHDRDVAAEVLQLARAVLARSADDDTPARVELREMLARRVFT